MIKTTTKKRTRSLRALLSKLRGDPAALALVVRVIEELARRSPVRRR